MARQSSQGTTLEIVGSPNVEVGHITTLPTPSPSRPDIDITTLGSTAREYLLGLGDSGTISLSLIADSADAGQTQLEGARNSNTATDFIITADDGTTIEFSALVNEYSWEFGVDAAVTSTIGLRVTGAVTFTFPSS